MSKIADGYKFYGYIESLQSFLQHYKVELLRQSISIRKKCEELFALCPSMPETGNQHYMLYSQPEALTLVWGILSEAANISKLASPASNKYKCSQKKYAKMIRKARVKCINGILNKASVTEILNRDVRNTLDHFDEYFDEEIAEIIFSKKKHEFSGVSIDIALSSIEVFNPPTYMIRTYVSLDRTFHNFKRCVNIGAIYAESIKIIDILSEEEIPRGGVIIPIKSTAIPIGSELEIEIHDDLSYDVVCK